MPIHSLINKINTLESKRQVCIIGAAIIDFVANTPNLPNSGEDVMLSNPNIHIGGCAFNIALTLKRMGIHSDNILPIGKGIFASEIQKIMRHYGIESAVNNFDGDNGWCMALVEPSGERTFLTIEGVENQWMQSLLEQVEIKDNALIYLSGYQLTSKTGDNLLHWLESLSIPFELFLDLGPRICNLTQLQFDRLLKFKPILSLNRQEAEFLGLNGQTEKIKENVANFAHNWFLKQQTPIIVRLDCHGAYAYDGHTEHWVDVVPAKVVDTIGAGDSHAGGVLAALATGLSLNEALILGNAIASYVVSHHGADCSPTKSQLVEYIQRH